MKKKILKIPFYTAYILALIFALCFIYYLIKSWLFHKGIWAPENIALIYIPFSAMVKQCIKKFLVPSVISLTTGLVLQKIYKSKLN